MGSLFCVLPTCEVACAWCVCVYVQVSDRLQIVWLLLQHLCGALLSKQFTHSESSSSRPAPPSDSDIHRSLQSFQQVMYKQGGVPVLQDYEQLLGSVVASLPSRMASPLR